jgi:nitrogen fixation protein FixH
MTGRLTGRGVLIWLFGFFGIIFAINTYFIMVSSRTFRGEDEQKPYLQGVEFNQTLVRRSEQHVLGWRASITAIRLADGHVRIEVTTRDRNGKAVVQSGMSGELRHPADENRDRVLRLNPAAPGTYRAELTGVSPGVWDVLIHSTRGQAPFEAVRRVWVR